MDNKQRKLTREEKISQFNDLRKNYCALMKSLKFYEDECSKLTNTSSAKSPQPSVNPEKPNEEENGIKSETSKKIEKRKVCLKWMQDPDLPAGWQYADQFTSQHSHVMKHYKSPAGDTYQGIPQLLREFIRSGKGREPLKKCLKREGWFETELLPPGLLMRQKRSEKGFTYLTSEAKKFLTTVSLVKYLKEEYKWDKKLVDRFLNEHKSLYSEDVLPRKPLTKIKQEEETTKNTEKSSANILNSNGLQWKPDIFLPEGWRVAVTKHKNSSEVKRYMSPEGELLGNLPKALKHILLCGSVTDEQMEILKDGLEYDGWSKETQLPEGWRVKRELKIETFLSPDLDLFSNKNELSKYLEQNGLKEQSEKLIGRRNMKPLNSNITKDNWESDSSLPAGWMSAWSGGEENIKSKFKRFKSPSQRIFNSRSVALKDMMANKHLQRDIEIMKDGFFSDGWVQIDGLPKGWLKYQLSKETKFLSPDYHTIRQSKMEQAFQKYNIDKSLIPLLLKNNIYRPLGSEEDYKDDASLPKGWKSQVKSEISNRMANKKIMSPNGKIFYTRASAIRQMISETYSSDDIVEMKNGFIIDGWVPIRDFPSGWMQHSTAFSYMNFLTPKYHMIKSCEMEKRFEQLSLDKSLLPLLSAIKRNFLQSKKEQNPTIIIDEWQDDFSLPSGWQICWDKEPQRNHKFKTRSDRIIIGRSPAMRVMIAEKYPEEDLEKMKKGFGFDGWKKTIYLPPGWMKKECSGVMSFLTPEFQVIKDKNVEIFFDKYKLDKSLITMLKWEKSEEENILDLLAEENSSCVQLNGLPKDWRAELNDSGSLLIFNPDGKQFTSRIEALQFMVQTNYDAKTIHSFWKGLEEEGWRVDDRIPSGWRVRRPDGEDGDYEYLSSKMTILSSTEEAMDVIKSSGNFEQVIQFEAFVARVKSVINV